MRTRSRESHPMNGGKHTRSHGKPWDAVCWAPVSLLASLVVPIVCQNANRCTSFEVFPKFHSSHVQQMAVECPRRAANRFLIIHCSTCSGAPPKVRAALLSERRWYLGPCLSHGCRWSTREPSRHARAEGKPREDGKLPRDRNSPSQPRRSQTPWASRGGSGFVGLPDCTDTRQLPQLVAVPLPLQPSAEHCTQLITPLL